MFTCKSCENHAQELREMRMSHESEKAQMRKEHKEQLDRLNEMIGSLHDRLMSRDIHDLEAAKNPPQVPEITPEDDPYIDLQDVPNVVSEDELKKASGN